MSSASQGASERRPDDRTASARIRDAAITCFAADGVAATSVRAIAAEAGVSPALVIHHFGSKDALVRACDEHIAATIRERKAAAMAAGPGLDPLAALRQSHEGLPVLGYLVRTLTDPSPQVASLVDELVTDAEGYMAQGVESGLLRPSEHPYGRAVLLTIWSLGALALHEHVERLLGVDITGSDGELAEAGAYFAPALELFSQGLMTPAAAAQMHAALDRVDPPTKEATS